MNLLLQPFELEFFSEYKADSYADLHNIDKDDEYLSEYTLIELADMGALIAETQPDHYLVKTDTVICDLLNHNQMDSPAGSYQFTLMYRKNYFSDMEYLSGVHISLLPELFLATSDSCMVEGEGATLTVSCANPWIMDPEENSTPALSPAVASETTDTSITMPVIRNHNFLFATKFNIISSPAEG